MADTLLMVAHNLNDIAGELLGYETALELVVEEARINNGRDSQIVITKAITGGAIASMIIIKACGFEDELRKHYLANFRDTQTDAIKKSISELNKLFKDQKLRKLRNYVLAHHNREKEKLLIHPEIVSMFPYTEPFEYYALIYSCKKVARAIMALI